MEPLPEPGKKICGFQLWDDGPLCERPAAFKATVDYCGHSALYCARHGRIVEDLEGIRLLRII